MRYDPPRPTLHRFLLRNPVASLSTLALFISWSATLEATWIGFLPIYIGRIVFSTADVMGFLVTALGVTLGAAPLLWRRTREFLAIRAVGVVIQGQITRTWQFWLYRRIEFVYIYQGQKLHNRCYVYHTRSTRLLQPGHTLEVVVDQYRPDRSFLHALYL